MGKKLSEMTLEELWRLFPIQLQPHDPRWKTWYGEQERALQGILPEGSIYAIDHIGSTAVENIWAKPIVDIMVRLRDMAQLKRAAEALVDCGYIRMNKASFNLGYTERGFAEKVFHIHLRGAGEDDELYFRDRLRKCPDVAREYEKLKLRLWKEYEFDRDGYTRAKTDFVLRQTHIAKTAFEYMDNADFDVYSAMLYEILDENGCSAGMSYDQWHMAVGAGMKKPQRRIVLIRYGGDLAGFFQYYINEDTFMMEEIQLRRQYRHEYGLFRGLYGFLLPRIPEGAQRVRAYTEMKNEASQAILCRLGLARAGEDGRFLAFEGTLDALKKWYYE